MKIMYREEYSRKKLPAVVGIFFFMALLIFVSDTIKESANNNVVISVVVSVTLPLAIIISVVLATIKCRCKFRYSLIADQFIIHRLNGQDLIIEKNIELEQVVSIEQISSIKFLFKRMRHQGYILSLFNRRTFSCTYKQGNDTETFFFQPSEIFVNKIKGNMVRSNQKLVS